MTVPLRSAGRAKTLEAKYYNSAEIFALETERIFACHWRCVAREAELAGPGSHLLLEVDGESLILLRDQDGRIQCFYNVCRHRGTRLCGESDGALGNTIRCPYHGWTYALSGELLAAPNMTDATDFERSSCGLKAVPTATWSGFVLINFAGDPPLATAFAPVLEKFQTWSLDQLTSVDRRCYEVHANWKLLFQNYNECYHCPHLHPALNRLSPYLLAENDLHEGPFLGGPMQLSDGVDSMTTTGAACAALLPGLPAKPQRRVYYYSLFPSLLLSPHPDFVLVHRVERVSLDTSRVVCELLFHPDAVAAPGFDPAPAVQFWDETNRQDWHICELSQQGISSRAYEPGPYSSLESTVAAFDCHYLRVLGQ